MNYTFHEIFDNRKLDELYEGDMETVLLMFESFATAVLPEFPLLKKHAENENWYEVKNLSHKFLPTFAMMGLMEIHENLRDIEDDCKAHNYDQIPNKVRSVDEKVKKITPIVKMEHKNLKEHLNL